MSVLYSEDVTIPGLPSLSKGSRRSNWRIQAAEKARWERDVYAAFIDRLPPRPLARARVYLTRMSSGAEPDIDNLWASMGGILDGLVKAGVLEDDKPSVIYDHGAGYEKVPRAEQGIRIQVEGEITCA